MFTLESNAVKEDGSEVPFTIYNKVTVLFKLRYFQFLVFWTSTAYYVFTKIPPFV